MPRHHQLPWVLMAHVTGRAEKSLHPATSMELNRQLATAQATVVLQRDDAVRRERGTERTPRRHPFGIVRVPEHSSAPEKVTFGASGLRKPKSRPPSSRT